MSNQKSKLYSTGSHIDKRTGIEIIETRRVPDQKLCKQCKKNPASNGSSRCEQCTRNHRANEHSRKILADRARKQSKR